MKPIEVYEAGIEISGALFFLKIILIDCMKHVSGGVHAYRRFKNDLKKKEGE